MLFLFNDRLFEKYPDVQDIFIPFKGQTLEELKNCDRLREHGLQVMRTVEKVIARLDEPRKMYTMLYELGQKHVMFNTKVDYMDVSNLFLKPFCFVFLIYLLYMCR